MYNDVVGTHGHEVDTDGPVAARIDRQAQLRADTVRAGDQHGLLVARRQLHKRAEAADAGQDLRALRSLDDGFDALDELVAGVDVDARIAVGEAGAFFHGFQFCRWPCGTGACGIVHTAQRRCARDSNIT